MVLQRLQLTNFRGFESLDLTFERDLTVLVGVNGCGKTTVIDALLIGLGCKTWTPISARRKALVAALTDLPKDRHWPAQRVAEILARLRASDAPIPYQAWVEQWLEGKLSSR